MKGKVSYISFSDTFLQYVKNADPDARLGYLASTVDSSVISKCLALRTETNEVFADIKLSALTAARVNMCITNKLPLEVWTVNTEYEIENMHQYISGVTSDNLVAGKVLYNKAMQLMPEDIIHIPTTSITLNKSNIEFKNFTGQQLTANVMPADATAPVIWSSSNTSVATVSSSGFVTPITNGTCVITAISDTCSATCDINVNIQSYTVTADCVGCTIANLPNTILAGSTINATIAPAVGYVLDGINVMIKHNGVDITQSAYANGYINIDNVFGDIEIIVACQETKTYTITRNLIYCSSSNENNKVNSGDTLTEIITADQGYTLRGAECVVMMGNEDISYMYSNGVLNIPAVTDNVSITLIAIEFVGGTPIVDLDFSTFDGTTVSNVGAGGAVYDGTLGVKSATNDSASIVDGNVLNLHNHAYLNVPYGFKSTDNFTIVAIGNY